MQLQCPLTAHSQREEPGDLQLRADAPDKNDQSPTPTGCLLPTWTGVNQLKRSGWVPCTMPKNSRCKALVIGPTFPLPTVMRSTERIGVTSAAVPVKKASSAMYNISRGIGASATGIPKSRANLSIESRVMPGSTEFPSGAVCSTPLRTMNTFSPDPSLT